MIRTTHDYMAGNTYLGSIGGLLCLITGSANFFTNDDTIKLIIAAGAWCGFSLAVINLAIRCAAIGRTCIAKVKKYKDERKRLKLTHKR